MEFVAIDFEAGCLPIHQLVAKAGNSAGLAFVGTAGTIADEMQQGLEEEGSDGFNIMFPFVPAGLDAFATKVVPEPQCRGIFRTDYEGVTLRDHLGLPRAESRFFPVEARAVAAE